MGASRELVRLTREGFGDFVILRSWDMAAENDEQQPVLVCALPLEFLDQGQL